LQSSLTNLSPWQNNAIRRDVKAVLAVIRRLSFSTLVAFWVLNGLAMEACFGQAARSAENGSVSRSAILSRADGRIDVVSGDLMWIGIHRIMLDGIVVLKSSHRCHLDGRDQNCARRMRESLAGFARHDDFRCELVLTRSGRPKFVRGGRYAALCFIGETEVNQELVALGWALAEKGNAGH